jgi:hypothetical protein
MTVIQQTNLPETVKLFQATSFTRLNIAAQPPPVKREKRQKRAKKIGRSKYCGQLNHLVERENRTTG